jgi:hypothetical protein
VHKLKKGPILVPMYAHITITSLGTAAQKKAVIYHREVREGGRKGEGVCGLSLCRYWVGG